jgi:hypothetical protein
MFGALAGHAPARLPVKNRPMKIDLAWCIASALPFRLFTANPFTAVARTVRDSAVIYFAIRYEM